MEVHGKDILLKLERIRELDQMIHVGIERMGELIRETEMNKIEKEFLRAEIDDYLAAETRRGFETSVNCPTLVLN